MERGEEDALEGKTVDHASWPRQDETCLACVQDLIEEGHEKINDSIRKMGDSLYCTREAFTRSQSRSQTAKILPSLAHWRKWRVSLCGQLGTTSDG